MILEPVIMEYKRYKMVFNHVLTFVTFQSRGLHHLDLYGT